MGGYTGIQRSSSHCIHFVGGNEVNSSDREIAVKLQENSIKCAYVDYREVKDSGQHIANVIASSLKLEHAPYGPRSSPHQPRLWVPFLDDLLARSHHENGVVIIIDNADLLLAENRNDMFDLIEAFLIQFHHWFEKKKPCHLCFQMEPNELVRRIYSAPRVTVEK